MKRALRALVAVMFVTMCASSFAEMGASQKAYEHASDEAVFVRVSDWFATLGKPEDEKQAIVAERRAKRAVEKAEKEAKKAMKKAEKDAEKAEKKAQEKSKEMKKMMNQQSDKMKKMMK